MVFRGFSSTGKLQVAFQHLDLFILVGLIPKIKMFVPLSSNEDVDEGFVINQEGIGLRLTAMEYWKCSKVGIALPFAHKKEPDCKFVIAESLPEQGNRPPLPSIEVHNLCHI